MATFWWNWSKYTLGSGHKIDDVYNALATYPDGLQSLGYTDIKFDKDVRGTLGKFSVAVLFLEIGGSDYWQIVSCFGEGTVADAKSDISSVIDTIKIQKTLYF